MRAEGTQVRAEGTQVRAEGVGCGCGVLPGKEGWGWNGPLVRSPGQTQINASWFPSCDFYLFAKCFLIPPSGGFYLCSK